MSSNSSVLTDVADVIDSSHKTPIYETIGVPMVRVTDVRFGTLSLNAALQVSEETYKEYSRKYLPKKNDIIISRVGSYGRTSRVLATKFCMGQNVASISPRDIDHAYLYYTLNSPQISSQIEANVVGSTQKSLSLKAIRELKIPRFDPVIETQIGAMLGSIDNRITLLRETNETFEAIAKAVFKSWFIDFDPVRAKQQAQIPEGMDEATAALFPDSFEESELGLMPKGWNIGEFGKILSLRNERTQPSEETKFLPYVPIESIGAKTPFLTGYKSGEEANSSLVLFKESDILFGAMRPYFHKVCIAPFDGVTRTTVFTLTAVNKKSNAYGLFLAFQESTIEFATQHSEGSTIPYAKWKNSLERMPIVEPPIVIQEKFGEIVWPLLERANHNCKQEKILSQLRDTLLPRLISGQLRIAEAEDAVEEVAA
nr:restriction endonuclease subunit S [uncultured Undibacterium sp.]